MSEHAIYLGGLNEWPTETQLDQLQALNENLGRSLAFPFFLRGLLNKHQKWKEGQSDSVARTGDFNTLVVLNERFVAAVAKVIKRVSIGIGDTILVFPTTVPRSETSSWYIELDHVPADMSAKFPVNESGTAEFICQNIDNHLSVIPFSSDLISSTLWDQIAKALSSSAWIFRANCLLYLKFEAGFAEYRPVIAEDLHRLPLNDESTWVRYFECWRKTQDAVSYRSRLGLSVEQPVGLRAAAFLDKLCSHEELINVDFSENQIEACDKADSYLKVSAAICDLQGRKSVKPNKSSLNFNEASIRTTRRSNTGLYDGSQPIIKSLNHAFSVGVEQAVEPEYNDFSDWMLTDLEDLD